MNNQDNYSYEKVLELTKQGIEIWRRVVIDDIVFDYEISNLGRIKSLKWRGNGKEIGYGNSDKKEGYMVKSLHYTDKNGNKKCKSYLVHRLVAIMFIPNTFNKPCIDHKDTSKSNNKVDNLRWVTYEENINNDKTKNNISESLKGKTRRNLTDEEKYPYVTEENVLSEEWKNIIGHEGIYEISNMGRVKSLGFKREGGNRCKEGLVQPSIDKNGYQIVGLTDKNGKRRKHLVHRLVAEHFINNPNNHKIVDHINTNKIDNRYFNLRWVTQKENMNNDKTIEKLTKAIKKPVIILDRNGNIISNGLGVEETAKYIGVDKCTLINLLKSDYPYRAKINSGGSGDANLLRSLNGIRAYYIDTYNEEEVLKEIAEDKTDYSYCPNDLICVYVDGIATEPMSGRKLAKELGMDNHTLNRIRDSKKPYRPRNKKQKHLEGIKIMYYEDYLKEQSQQDN